MADRARAGAQPGGTSVLLVALLLAVSASGCGQLDDSIDSLTLRLEEWDRHRHDTAGKSGQGTALPHQASVREWEPAPAQRSARVRGALIAGLAVSRADTPPGGTGLHRSPTGQEAQPPRQARSSESLRVKKGLPPGVGSALARTRVAAPEGRARSLASGPQPGKAIRQAVSVSAPRLQGVVRGRWIQSTEPANVERPLMGVSSPPRPLLARLGTPGKRSPEAVRRPSNPEEPPRSALARRGRVARVPPGRERALVEVRPEGDAGPPRRGRVPGGLARRAPEHHPVHRVRPPLGDRAEHRARRPTAGSGETPALRAPWAAGDSSCPANVAVRRAAARCRPLGEPGWRTPRLTAVPIAFEGTSLFP